MNAKSLFLALFLSLSLSLILVGCRSWRRVQTVEHIRHDTLYVNTIHYDSVFIDQWQTRDRLSDTVRIETVRLEYKYKLLRDTIRVVRVDSIPVIREVEVVRTERKVPSIYKWALGICLTVVIILLVLAIIFIIRKIRKV